MNIFFVWKVLQNTTSGGYNQKKIKGRKRKKMDRKKLKKNCRTKSCFISQEWLQCARRKPRRKINWHHTKIKAQLVSIGSLTQKALLKYREQKNYKVNTQPINPPVRVVVFKGSVSIWSQKSLKLGCRVNNSCSLSKEHYKQKPSSVSSSMRE